MTLFQPSPDQRDHLLLSLADIPFPSEDADRPADLLSRCPRAGKTPLQPSPELAARAGIAEVWIKDERGRMGLGSFKALGAAYVIAHEAQQDHARGQTYVTASAGNHGQSVAAGAAAFGARAVIFLARTVPESFAERLRAEGAEVRREGAIYEESMEAAAACAEREGWVLLSDSSWPGYLDRPHRLMEGYLVLMQEAVAQMDRAPSHIFLQAGVGGLAAACAAFARKAWGETPHIVIVEPEAAPAIFASVQAGTFTTSVGPESVMGRLDCKEASLIALKGLARDADSFQKITEQQGIAASDLSADIGLPSTPSGAAGIAGLLAASATAGQVGLGPDARVLLILSEEAAA